MPLRAAPFALAVFCAAADTSTAAAQPSALFERVSDSIVQIGLANRARSVALRMEGSFHAVDLQNGEKHALKRGELYESRSDKHGRIRLGDTVLSGAVRLLPDGPEDYVKLGEKRYRGNVLLKPGEGGTVTVVNELGIEEYLYGVLAKEMSPEWPLEALKAQAVVARTWALNNLGKYSELGYDLTDDVRSQIYSGLDAEADRAREAVRATAGQVLSFKGRLLTVFFHACCGGHTAPAAAVWGGTETPKPLRGVRDKYCAHSPYYKWSAYFANDDILGALNDHGFDLERLDALRPGKRDASGWLKEVRARCGRKTVTVKANDLRTWLGPTELKSAQVWRIIRRKKGYEFVGRGYGHGVGLCQWGAFAQANEGRGYKKILAHYFPGSEIVQRDE